MVARPTAKSVPTSAIAPSTCRNSGRLTESGRIAASTSGTRLPEHEDEDDEHGEAVDRLEANPLRPVRDRVALERLAGLAARPAADRPEHEGREDPAVPELVGVEVDREPDPEHERRRHPDA